MNQTGISRTLKRILLKMRRMMTDAKWIKLHKKWNY
jgi:hypothetical protein